MLNFAAEFEGLREGRLIGMLDVAADRNSETEAGHFERFPFQQSREIECGCLSLRVRVHREDHFFDCAVLKAVQEFFDFKLLWFDSFQRRNCTHEDMVTATKTFCLLKSQNILRLLDNAEGFVVTLRIFADDAKVFFA